LGPWIEAEREQDRKQSESYREGICAFAEWCDYYGVSLAAGGHIVAGYLLELGADGAPLPVLIRVAAAVDFLYRRTRRFLEREPIDAALALMAAQMSVDRTLN